jgi:hypothetical protein
LVRRSDEYSFTLLINHISVGRKRCFGGGQELRSSSDKLDLSATARGEPRPWSYGKTVVVVALVSAAMWAVITLFAQYL